MEISINQNGWAVSKLEDIAYRITKGGTPTTYGYSFQKEGINFIKVENIENGRVNLKSITDFIGIDAHNFQSKSQLSVNDILFSIAGTIGETCVIKEEYLPANTNQALAIIKGTACAIIPKLLGYQLDTFVAKVKLKARGGAMNNVSLDDLKKLLVYIPPLPEQHRIVAKIEELFSDLDKGIESLKTAQAQLKVYRQAVLKWAFEGKLTNENVKEGELPEGWNLSDLGKLKEFSLYGPRFSSKDYSENGVAILRTSDISDNGKVDWVNAPKLQLSENEYEKYKLIKNDLLITRTGSIGTISVFNDDKRAIAGAFLIYYRLKTVVNVQYIFYFLKSRNAQKHLREHSSGVGRPNLNVPNIELLEIPLAPFQEQHRIVSEIETRLSVCDKMEESISQSLEQAEALRQSILKRAFEGKLVPQDPSDEPASALLERIRAERANGKK